MGRVHSYVSSLLFIGDMLNCNISPKDGNMIKKKGESKFEMDHGLEYPVTRVPLW